MVDLPGRIEKLPPQKKEFIERLRRPSFQARVLPWLITCFGEEITFNYIERNHRFLEEALELVQANGCTKEEAYRLVDYVYGRPSGEPFQEAGGVLVTLAALCIASGISLEDAGETELARIWSKMEKIRAKQTAKPDRGPLPGPSEGEKVCPDCDGSGWQGHGMGGDTCGKCGGSGRVKV